MPKIKDFFRCAIKFHSRRKGKGGSVIAKASYRAGERLYDEREDVFYDYTNKGGIVYTAIMLPENAPRNYQSRQTLWNAVEWAEKRIDARTAREVELGLPNELNLKEHIQLVHEYVAANFTSQGMCADIAIHSGKHEHSQDSQHIEAENDTMISQENPHAHILLTTRPVEPDGFADKKNRDWESPRNVYVWRKSWADVQNRAFERKGLDIKVEHESFKKRGIDRKPTIHEGHEVTALERRGVRTEVGNKNRAIRAENKAREQQREQKRQHQWGSGADGFTIWERERVREYDGGRSR